MINDYFLATPATTPVHNRLIDSCFGSCLNWQTPDGVDYCTAASAHFWTSALVLNLKLRIRLHSESGLPSNFRI